MAKKPNLSNAEQGIAIEQLLAAPFVAAASANSEMAKKQTAFLMDTCFDIDNDDGFAEDTYLPKMISMTMTKNTLIPADRKNSKPRMEQLTTKFQVPLLTLVPFSALSIKNVSVKFDLEIVSQTGSPKRDTRKSKDSSESKMKGIVSYDSSQNERNQYHRRNAAKLSVEMNADTIPLSIGFTTLLDLYAKNINPTELDRRLAEKED